MFLFKHGGIAALYPKIKNTNTILVITGEDEKREKITNPSNKLLNGNVLMSSSLDKKVVIKIGANREIRLTTDAPAFSISS